jgi:hypothetical protein
MGAIPSSAHLAQICREIEATLLKLTKAHTAGIISEAGFVDVLLRLEEEKAAPFGFVLTASNTYDDWTILTLRAKGSSRPCAAFEFLPSTGEFRTAGVACREPGPHQTAA